MQTNNHQLVDYDAVLDAKFGAKGTASRLEAEEKAYAFYTGQIIEDARKKANEKYIKNNYDEIKTRVPKGRKAEIQTHAEKQGKSLNAFVNEAIDEKIERDNAEDET